MTGLDFDSIRGELFDSDELSSMVVFVREGFYSVANQIPAMLVVTDEVIYYGGCVGTKHDFHRIPLKSVHSVTLRGKSFMRCVEVRYLALDGDRKIFFCPFSGEPHQPGIDVEKLHELHRILKRSLG